MARSLMRQQMNAEGHTLKDFDWFLFKRNNKLLYRQLLDNEVNVHELSPYDNSMLATEAKTLFPTLYKRLYSGEQVPRYECRRAFCTFCLRNSYEQNVVELAKNKQWHCHHCTGYCQCTRCLRADHCTQARAFLISIGGDF